MSQTVAIILRYRQEDAESFEQMFRSDVLPLWEEFKAQGKFITASLTPVEDGSEVEPGLRDYILHVELPGTDEHHEFDTDARFMSFLERARPLQPREPRVWLGETLLQV